MSGSRRETKKLIHLLIRDGDQTEKLITTDTHPFYVSGKGFIPAAELCVGDELCCASTAGVAKSQGTGIIEKILLEVAGKPVKVYNFQVEDLHTYQVGLFGVWVHNMCQVDPAENNNGRYSGKMQKVNNPDAAADALARRIGGESRVKFSTDPSCREFDAISKDFVAQAKPALKSLNINVRRQMKATFEAAKELNKKVYYQFDGKPAQSVIDKLMEYSSRYQVDVIIDTSPFI